MPDRPEHLFVYGTLRSGHAPLRGTPLYDLMERHFRLLGAASAQGQLFEIAGYPGMLASGDKRDRVIGELYLHTGSADVWDSLDSYEGCSAAFPEPHEYIRRQIPVLLLAQGRTLSAWTWLYNWPIDVQRRIVSGDYNALAVIPPNPDTGPACSDVEPT